LFESCLNARSFNRVAVLYGLSSDGLFLVSLPSAGAYTRLMALNAGWSAMRAGRNDLAGQYMGIALGLMAIPAEEKLTQAIEELRAQLQ